MSVNSFCACKKRMFQTRYQAGHAGHALVSQEDKVLCLHFSPQICSLPPPQPQLSTASQAPRTSSPLPAQVSSSAGSQYFHTTANPEPWQASLSASSPMGRPADHDGLMAQLVAAGLPPHCSPLPAAPFQRLCPPSCSLLLPGLLSMCQSSFLVLLPPGPSDSPALLKPME